MTWRTFSIIYWGAIAAGFLLAIVLNANPLPAIGGFVVAGSLAWWRVRQWPRV